MWKIVGLALFALGFAKGVAPLPPSTVNLPVSVAYFPLNDTYGLEELCNRAPTGNVLGPGHVRLAPGPDGLAQGSHELSGGGFIEFPNEPGGVLDIRYSMSMLFWVFPNESNTLYSLVHYRNASNGEQGPFVGRSSLGNRFESRLVSRDGFVNLIARGEQNALPSGVWSHVAFTYDNDTGVLKLFLNGSVIDTTIGGSIEELATQHSLVAGSGEISFVFYTGRITQIAVYDESLSDEQVSAIFTGASEVTCVCDPATQFTCDNAFCIDLDKKCDDIADCRDRSDERGCILSLDEDPSGIVDCGNNGTGITITIINIRDVTQWIRDSDEWRLNDDDDDDCAPTFGVSNATYFLRFGSDCAAVVSESDAFVYTFIINASKQGFSATFALNHFYSITCGYGRNGTVFSSFDTVKKFQVSGADTNSLSFALKLCNDVSCAEQFIIGNTPIPLRSIIYASVSVGHGFQGVVDLLLEELFISVDSAGREKREVLITNSCEVAGKEYLVSYNCSGQVGETERAGLTAARYPGENGPVWVHASVYACLSDNSSSLCQTLCDGCSKRKRRDTGQFSDIKRYKLSTGPFIFTENEEEQKDTTEEQQDEAAAAATKLIIILGVSGIVVTAIVCATVLMVLRKRRLDIAATQTPASKNAFENQGCEPRDIASKT